MVTMPKRRVEICPQCSHSIKRSESRLIRDTCGHKKCRLCLMKEEMGCIACAAKESKRTHKRRHVSCRETPDVISDASNDVNTFITSDHSTAATGTAVHEKETKENGDCKKANNTSKPGRKKFIIESHIAVLPGTPKKYHCTLCDKICATKMSLRYHNYCASKPKPYSCETCDKGFVTKSHYEYHMKIHTGALPYVCPVCGKGFKEQGKLARHSNTRHSGDRPFVCQECGKTFTNVESLKSHQRTHTGEKPHVCHLCSKAFTEHSNYLKHVSFHKGEKLHMCDVCGKTFAMKRSLVTHTLMIHVRERNHICNTCNRKFTLKRDLKRHEIVHSVVRPHSCTLCNLGFRRKDNLERHMKNTHPETRMVIVGSNKLKSIEVNKSPPDTVGQSNEENTEDTDERAIDDPPTPLPPSPIPPSQTVNVETLRSIQKISSDKNKCDNRREDVSTEINHVCETNVLQNTTDCLHSDMQVNYTNNTALTQESLSVQMQEQCYENTEHMQKTIVSSETPFVVHEATNQTATHTIYPPKKNIEYYRAVPVINRSTIVTNNCTNEANCHTVTVSDQQEIVRRVEGTNCVPTITRACEYMPGSVITRNLQLTNSTVLKPISRDDNFQTSDSLPCLVRESHSNQPSLRKLLHDVKCSDGSDVLNLTNDVNMNKRTLFPDDFRQPDNMKFDKRNHVEAQFYTPKYPDAYLPESSTHNRGNEHPLNSSEHYLPLDYGRKIAGTEVETLFSVAQFRQNYGSSLNYDLIQPTYIGYEDGIGQSLPRYPDVVSPTDLVNRYSTDLNKHSTENYMYDGKHVDSASQLKQFAEVMHLNGGSCAQSIGQPVIVGTKKISNNVICSNFGT